MWGLNLNLYRFLPVVVDLIKRYLALLCCLLPTLPFSIYFLLLVIHYICNFLHVYKSHNKIRLRFDFVEYLEGIITIRSNSKS